MDVTEVVSEAAAAGSAARPQADPRSAVAVELEVQRVLAALHGDDEEQADVLIRPEPDRAATRR